MSSKYAEVVKKIVGPVMPVGETWEDEERLKNLKELGSLVNELTEELYDVKHRGEISHEGSVTHAGKEAEKILKSLKDWIEE